MTMTKRVAVGQSWRFCSDWRRYATTYYYYDVVVVVSAIAVILVWIP